MASTKEAPVKATGKTAKYVRLTLDQVQIEDGFNARIVQGDIKGLANSIAANGVKEPLRGYPIAGGKYVVVNGHRRAAAIKLAQETTGEVISFDFMVDTECIKEEHRNIQQLVSNDGQPFSMVEEAEVFRRLKQLGRSNVEIAEAVGRSKVHVGNCLKLLELDKKVIKDIANGTISATHALELLKETGSPEGAEEAITKAKAKGAKKVTAKSTGVTRNAKKVSKTEIKEENGKAQKVGHTLNKGLVEGILETLDAKGRKEELDDLMVWTLRSLIAVSDGTMSVDEYID